MDRTHGGGRRSVRIGMVAVTLLTASVGLAGRVEVAHATTVPVRCLRIFSVGRVHGVVAVPCPGEKVVSPVVHPTGRLTYR